MNQIYAHPVKIIGLMAICIILLSNIRLLISVFVSDTLLPFSQNPNHDNQLELWFESSSSASFCFSVITFEAWVVNWSNVCMMLEPITWFLWQSFDLRLFDRIDSSMILLPRKKSVATMLATDHHSSRYHLVTLRKRLSFRRIKQATNQNRNNVSRIW